MKSYMLVLAATALVPAAFLQPAFAQEMFQPSSGDTVDVQVEPEWGATGNSPTNFKISFLTPGTDTVLIHEWWNLKIMDSSGAEVYNAAAQINQSVNHSAEGVVTVPYTFEENGSFTLVVEILGTPGSPSYIPITPETAEFPINVTPEFPAGALSVIAAVTAGTIAVARIKKL